MRTAKTLIRLGGCPGWSESSLGAQVVLLVLSCSCSTQIYLVDSSILIIWTSPFPILGVSDIFVFICIFNRNSCKQTQCLQRLIRVYTVCLDLKNWTIGTGEWLYWSRTHSMKVTGRFAHFPVRPESFRPRVVSPFITWVVSPTYPESFRPLFGD